MLQILMSTITKLIQSLRLCAIYLIKLRENVWPKEGSNSSEEVVSNINHVWECITFRLGIESGNSFCLNDHFSCWKSENENGYENAIYVELALT